MCLVIIDKGSSGEGSILVENSKGTKGGVVVAIKRRERRLRLPLFALSAVRALRDRTVPLLSYCISSHISYLIEQ